MGPRSRFAVCPGRHVVRLGLVASGAVAAKQSASPRWLWLGTWFDALLAGAEVGLHEAAIDIAEGQLVHVRYRPPVTVGAKPRVKVRAGPKQDPD